MRNITSKFKTFRSARAQTFVAASPETIQRVRDKKVPKGDIFEIARTAAFSGVKRCDELVPFCHSVPLDWVEIKFEIEGNKIIITTRTEAIYKTGVEIEALLAAQLAAINIYDLLKPIDEALEIGPTKLLEKEGGYHDFDDEFTPKLKAAVLVSSDSTAAGKRQDKSGLIIKEFLESQNIEVAGYDILPDDVDKIEGWLRAKCSEKINLIITTGGSGLGPRDCTVEATLKVIEKEVPGIYEAMRSYGRERTPFSMLSRSIAGIRGDTLIINMPGSSRGAEESLNALFPGVLHAFKMMRGWGH